VSRLVTWIRRLAGVALLGWAAWQIVRLARLEDRVDELLGDDVVDEYTIGPPPRRGLDLGQATDAAAELDRLARYGARPSLVELTVPSAE